MEQYESLLAKKAALTEQLRKVEEKEISLKEQKKELKESLEKLSQKIEIENMKMEAEKNKKIMDAVATTFGEVTEENYEKFLESMKEFFGEKGSDFKETY